MRASWNQPIAAGLRMLAAVQTPEGAIPGKTAARRAPPDATAARFFRLSYQTTLVTAMALVVLTPILEGAR